AQLAGRRGKQPVDHADQGGLAGAGQTHHHEVLAGLDAEARVDHRGREAVLAQLGACAALLEGVHAPLGPSAEDLVQAVGCDDWCHGLAFVGWGRTGADRLRPACRPLADADPMVHLRSPTPRRQMVDTPQQSFLTSAYVAHRGRDRAAGGDENTVRWDDAAIHRPMTPAAGLSDNTVITTRYRPLFMRRGGDPELRAWCWSLSGARLLRLREDTRRLLPGGRSGLGVVEGRVGVVEGVTGPLMQTEPHLLPAPLGGDRAADLGDLLERDERIGG